MKKIRNLIFDLGGVLYKIDYQNVSNHLQQLGGNLSFSQAKQDPIFDDFEIGKISPEEFRDGIRRIYNRPELSDNQIDEIWNSMLIGVFEGRTSLIESLGKKYPTVLLSNTNQIHFDHIEHEIQPLRKPMNKIFFSFQIGMRKPHREIFEYVLESMNFSPEETLFIEDSIQHIEGAQSVGIQTIFLQNPFELEKLLREKGLSF